MADLFASPKGWPLPESSLFGKSITKGACRCSGDCDVIRAIEIGELAFTAANTSSVQQAANEVVEVLSWIGQC